MVTGNIVTRAKSNSRDPRYKRITNKVIATRAKVEELVDLMVGWQSEKYLTRSVSKVKREIKSLVKREKMLIKMRTKLYNGRTKK